MANGTVEVLFAGQPCLTVSEGLMGSIWKINPVFAKLVYGANIFEDIPQCKEGTGTTEEAIAAGLVKLHELGAFNTEVDFPEDTYAATMNTVAEDVKAHSLATTNTLMEAHFKNFCIMKSIKDHTFPREVLQEDRSEYSANIGLSHAMAKAKSGKRQFVIKSDTGGEISKHDSDGEAMTAYKAMAQTKGVKIVREADDTHAEEEVFINGEELVESKEIDDKYEKWEETVRAAHPGKKLSFKGRVENGVHTTSAEESGQDRSYGVWDHAVNVGHVLEAKENEKEEEKEIVAALKKDKKFVSKWVKKESDEK